MPRKRKRKKRNPDPYRRRAPGQKVMRLNEFNDPLYNTWLVVRMVAVFSGRKPSYFVEVMGAWPEEMEGEFHLGSREYKTAAGAARAFASIKTYKKAMEWAARMQASSGPVPLEGRY